MNSANHDSSNLYVTPILVEAGSKQGSAPNKENTAGFLERFFDNFFQEKNIKWMLVVGAGIVFGSSLMLVTKAWPDWTPTLKYLTIVGYTTVIFLVSEVSRRRLRLNLTYKVLQALTLLLLPVCFLSLHWLSSGTAVQSLTQMVLMAPALVLLWQASTRILDHWLRGRQTTFLVSFGLLCMAGALPAMTTPIVAGGFVLACWLVLTAGALKVNRHTFWLSETHRLPRVFGFLPIAMLGLQFVVLVGTKAVTVLPAQWLGFATVLFSATVLLTARTVADVFRQRSGDLVRPLPWPIIVPLFSGLLLAVLGLALSMVGFSYVGPTTYAVVPTAIVAAMIYGLAARDTHSRGLVWASLIAITVAYQCSPVMFADLVQTLRSATAEAINQERVPLSMYGLTYLPMLAVMTLASRQLYRRKLDVFAEPMKQFVTLIAVGLLGIAVTDLTSLFIVSGVNVVAFLIYAIAFRDRRYLFVSLVALIATVATAIPATAQMGYLMVGVEWVPAALAGLACLMTATPLPDRLVNRIALIEGSRLDNGTYFFRRSDGRDRTVIQALGCVLAAGVGAHWVVSVGLTMTAPLALASVLQFAFLLTALLVYTLRQPSYLSAMCVWIFAGYAIFRYTFAFDFTIPEMTIGVSFVLIATSSLAYLLVWSLRSNDGKHEDSNTISDLRQTFGFASPDQPAEPDHATNDIPPLSPVSKPVAALALSLMDLSVIALTFLTPVFFLPVWVLQHGASIWGGEFHMAGVPWMEFSVASITVAIWFFFLAWNSKHRSVGFASAIMIPLVTTSVLIVSGIGLSMTELCLIWAAAQGICVLFYSYLKKHRDNHPALDAMLSIANVSMFGLVAASCLSFDWAMRGVFLIAAATSWRPAWRSGQKNKSRGDLAIFANVQLLLGIAALGGCHGLIVPGILKITSGETVANLLLITSISVIVFDLLPKFIWTRSNLMTERTAVWSSVLRCGLVWLAFMCFTTIRFSAFGIVLVTIGLAVWAIAEIWQAIQQQAENRVWTACIIALVATGFLHNEHVISFGIGLSQFVLLGIGIAALGLTALAQKHESLRAFDRPMQLAGNTMPAVVAVFAVVREFSNAFSSSTSLGALALMIAAGVYFHQAYLTKRHGFFVAGIAITNVGLFFLWRSLGWMAAELHMVPFGLSVLGLVELLKDKLPAASHNPLRYFAVLTIMCSPLFEVLGGSWLHMFSLMLLSVVMILAAIGLRLRSLVYAGTAFLSVDLIAMVIRSTIHNLNLLWICGVVLGVAVIGLAAFCENHRDKLLARIRIVSAELATWN